MWGPRKNTVPDYRFDIEEAERVIKLAEHELGGPLSLLDTHGANNRRRELEKRIEKNRRVIKKAEKAIKELQDKEATP